MKHKKDKAFYQSATQIFGNTIATRINWNEERQTITAGKINTPSGMKLNNESFQKLSHLSEDFGLPNIEVGRSGPGLLIELTK